MKIYEYISTKDYFGSLEPKTRLYFDENKQGYVYHYETERNIKEPKYTHTYTESMDYFIDLNTAIKYIIMEQLIPGPEYGELELKN